MPRVNGVDIPPNKRLDIALTYIYGVGPHVAKRLIDEAKLRSEMRARELSDEQVVQLNQLIERSFVTEGQLRRQMIQNVQRLKEIRCHRGLRHIRGLPVRGQRTKTNARTRKGPKRTVARKRSVKER